MPLDNASWERVRLAWNKLKFRKNHFQIDKRRIDQSNDFDAGLVPALNEAWDRPAIGDQRVRGMIERLVTLANQELSGHDINILVKTQPAGTIELKARLSATGDAGSAEAGDGGSAAAGDAEPVYEIGEVRDVADTGLLELDPFTAQVIAFAIKEGLPVVADMVKRLATETGVEFRQGYSDVVVNRADRFQMWIGQTDDTGSLWVNGTRVGGPVGINTGPFTFEVGRHLKPGGNVILVECDNSGRGRFSVGFGFFKNGRAEPRGTKWVGDDQLAMRRWFFGFYVFVD
ncbi:hypothetical protein [uncultured Enterovirga sp.]|uniref:hypothetical protein n=1 Tax=uncultured Enterovirga sp. TaxID=2026352 RepID=UPI0035CA0377